MLPVEIRARLRNVRSTIGFFSTNFSVGAGEYASTKASPVATALGASGNSLAEETPISASTAITDKRIDFMIASPMIGIDCEALDFRFALGTGCL